MKTIPRWTTICMLASAMACSAQDSAAIPDATQARHAAVQAYAGPGGDAILLQHDDGLLRLQLDEMAYRPVALDRLEDGGEVEWRRALPASFERQVLQEDSWSGCPDGDRVVRFEDAAQRNVVELRGCADGDAPAMLLTGFTFTDNVLAFRGGLRIGDTRAEVLQGLGMPHDIAMTTLAAPIDVLEVVNQERNNTLRLHFDDEGRLTRVEYEPYTG